MRLNEKANVRFFTFDSFSDTNLVKHLFSTKFGGVSKGIYESMNLAFRKDIRRNVIENYKIICNTIDVNYKNIVFSNQVHDNKVFVVTEHDKGKGLLINSDIQGYDALLTNDREVPLVAFFADCVPIYFLDVKKGVIAIAHSGWRGTLLEIALKTLEKMEEKFDCQLEDILVGIGPSIGECCFDVEVIVKNKFIKNIKYSKEFIKRVENTDDDKYSINLQGIIKQSLLNKGILEKNIETANLCTSCNSDMFFSHRVLGDNRGSLAGIISLK